MRNLQQKIFAGWGLQVNLYEQLIVVIDLIMHGNGLAVQHTEQTPVMLVGQIFKKANAVKQMDKFFCLCLPIIFAKNELIQQFELSMVVLLKKTVVPGFGIVEILITLPVPTLSIAALVTKIQTTHDQFVL